MNERAKIKAPAAPESVTTGPIAGSRKVYASPKGHADIRVPFREIALDPTANEPPLRVYDPPAPIPRPTRAIDLAAGLPPVREAWIAARGFAAIAGRAIKPEDNGSVSTERLAPPLPGQAHACAPARRASSVTQFEFARAGIVTEEMIYVAHRENLGARGGARRRRGTASPTARASARRSPNSSRRNSCAPKSRAAARSSPPTSTIPSSSR